MLVLLHLGLFALVIYIYIYIYISHVLIVRVDMLKIRMLLLMSQVRTVCIVKIVYNKKLERRKQEKGLNVFLKKKEGKSWCPGQKFMKYK